MKKFIRLIILMAVIFLSALWIIKINDKKTKKNVGEYLPLPEITSGMRGELGIDKNINEETIDKYLNRTDSVYRDMRMLEDPGNYEAIGGDRYLSGYVEGFEVVPLPYIIPVKGLPSGVGNTYNGNTLFSDINGMYVSNYNESMDIINKLFPKDKIIFLMCGGGGYAGMMKDFLVSLGWNENKIYVVGGYWYYNGKHNIKVKKEVNGKITYDFDKVKYHKIEFNKVAKIKNSMKADKRVSGIKINTKNLELEEGTSFNLKTIVLPNDAKNKEVKWKSSDGRIATVSNGLVKGVTEGKATIYATTTDGGKKVACEVTVKRRNFTSRIKLDDVSKESKELAKYDLMKLQDEFNNKVYNSDGTPKEGYYIDNGDGTTDVSDLWRKEDEKLQKKVDNAVNQRLKIFNQLLDNKKSFVVLVMTKACLTRDYSVVEGAAKILKENKYSYVELGSAPYDGDETLGNSKLNIKGFTGSIIIIKDGKTYAIADPDIDSLKNKSDVKNWLNKYLYIK